MDNLNVTEHDELDLSELKKMFEDRPVKREERTDAVERTVGEPVRRERPTETTNRRTPAKSGTRRPGRKTPSSTPRRRPAGTGASSEKGKGQPGRYLGNAPAGAKRRKKSKPSSKRWVILGIGIGSVALLIVSIVLMISSCLSHSPVEGTWKLDSMTTYEFYNEEQGALITSFNKKYSFNYTLEDDLLTIDFADPKVTDSVYRFTVNDDRLTLVGVSNHVHGKVHELRKQD